MSKYLAIKPGSGLTVAFAELDLDPTFSDAVSDAFVSLMVYLPSSLQTDMNASIGTSAVGLIDVDNFSLCIHRTAGVYYWWTQDPGPGKDFAAITFDAWVQVEIHATAGDSTYDVKIDGTTYSNLGATFLPASGVNYVDVHGVFGTWVGAGGGSSAADTIGVDEIAYALDNWISSGGTVEYMWAFETADPIGEATANYPTPPWITYDNGIPGVFSIETGGGGASADIGGAAVPSPAMESPGPGRVLIALSDGPLVPVPTWTAFDMLPECRCYGYDSFAGRQSELDTTETGRATVYFHDRNLTLDDTALVGCQILLQLYNPVLETWEPRWRGHIDDISREVVDIPGVPFADTSLLCTGIFDYLGGCKMITDVFGDPLPDGMSGVVFYEDGRVDDRCIHLLEDAGIDIDMRVTFTGNVRVNETLYDPDDVILQALRDAADAEFPGVANVYEDRFGRVVFHGRHARFDPEATAEGANWIFTRWDAATREDVTTGVAQLRDFSYNMPRTRIINSYLAYPRADENGFELKRDAIPSMQQTDPTSITNYGYRGRDAPDLIIKEHYLGSTGIEQCQLFGEFYITNYAEPRKAVQNVVFKSLLPTDERAAATYDLMCRADISDVINLTIDEAQLANVPFFIDGIAVECRVLDPAYDMITVSPNLTPAAYYDTDVFA